MADVVNAESTNNVAFVPLAPLSIAVFVGAGNSLLVHFSASGFYPVGGAQTFFRLVVDGNVGAPIKRSTFTRAGGGGAPGESTAIVAKITGLVGAHTIEIWWAVSGGGTTTIDPINEENHGTLLVQEVAV